MDAQAAVDHALQWQDLLQDAVDGAQTDHARSEFQKHLSDCTSCREEHAKLLSLHSRLKAEYSVPPILSDEFSDRVFARIDGQEQLRRASAKQRAEREFRERMRAFGLDWRDLWQRHMGSLIAAFTAVAGIGAALSSTWPAIREVIADSLSSVPALQGAMNPAVTAVAVSISISALALWILRTKNR